MRRVIASENKIYRAKNAAHIKRRVAVFSKKHERTDGVSHVSSSSMSSAMLRCCCLLLLLSAAAFVASAAAAAAAAATAAAAAAATATMYSMHHVYRGRGLQQLLLLWSSSS